MTYNRSLDMFDFYQFLRLVHLDSMDFQAPRFPSHKSPQQNHFRECHSQPKNLLKPSILYTKHVTIPPAKHLPVTTTPAAPPARRPANDHDPGPADSESAPAPTSAVRLAAICYQNKAFTSPHFPQFSHLAYRTSLSRCC